MNRQVRFDSIYTLESCLRTAQITKFQQGALSGIANWEQLGHALWVTHAIHHETSVLQTVSLDTVTLLHQATPQLETFTPLQRCLYEDYKIFV